MKFNKTQIINAVYSIVCLLAALTTLPPGLLPEKYRAMILSSVGLATWLKSHWNLFISPNGDKISASQELAPAALVALTTPVAPIKPLDPAAS